MYITLLKDREFFQNLLENDVFTAQGFAAWAKPDEGEIMPVLAANKTRYTAESFILAALKSDQSFKRVPGLEPDWLFVKQFAVAMVHRAIDDFGAYPIRRIGKGYWFSLSYFHSFSKAKAAEALNLKLSACVWNVITPEEQETLAAKFAKNVPRFAL